jgi:hypothetical protein
VRCSRGRLVLTAPPAGRFASFCARLRSGAGGLAGLAGGCIAAVAFEEFPVEAVLALDVFFAGWDCVVLFEDVFDYVHNAVGADAWTPAEITDGVVDACAASVALRLQSVAGDRAQRSGGVTGAHEDRVCGVAEVVDASARSGLMTANAIAWWSRQAKTSSGHGIWVGFEGHDGYAICQTEERADNATKRMTCKPDIGVRIAFGHIVVQVASGKVIVALLAEALDEAGRVAGIGVCHAVTDLLPAISSALTATARSEQVIVQLVVARGLGTIKDSHRGAFQSDDNRLIRLVRKDVSAQAILLPAKVFCVIESSSDILPLSCTKIVCVRVVGHPCKAQDRLFIRHVRSSYFIVCPGG